MLSGMSRLCNKGDVLTPLITLLVCLMIGGIMLTLVKAPGARTAVTIVLGAVFLAALFCALRGLAGRTRKLLSGHCPNPMCHGVVQHSELVPRGFLLCPTCKNRWPEIRGIDFKVTVRQ